MTIRSLINKKKRNFMLVTYGGFIVFIVGMVVRANSNTIPVVALLGFCAAFGAMVYAIFAYPYAKPLGLGVVVKQGTRWPGFLMATLITLVVAYFLARLMGVAIMLGIWIIAMVMAGYFKRKFSGLTGDTYGAINEVTEVSVLILVSFLARLGLA